MLLFRHRIFVACLVLASWVTIGAASALAAPDLSVNGFYGDGSPNGSADQPYDPGDGNDHVPYQFYIENQGTATNSLSVALSVNGPLALDGTVTGGLVNDEIEILDCIGSATSLVCEYTGRLDTAQAIQIEVYGVASGAGTGALTVLAEATGEIDLSDNEMSEITTFEPAANDAPLCLQEDSFSAFSFFPAVVEFDIGNIYCWDLDGEAEFSVVASGMGIGTLAFPDGNTFTPGEPFRLRWAHGSQLGHESFTFDIHDAAGESSGTIQQGHFSTTIDSAVEYSRAVTPAAVYRSGPRTAYPAQPIPMRVKTSGTSNASSLKFRVGAPLKVKVLQPGCTVDEVIAQTQWYVCELPGQAANTESIRTIAVEVGSQASSLHSFNLEVVAIDSPSSRASTSPSQLTLLVALHTVEVSSPRLLAADKSWDGFRSLSGSTTLTCDATANLPFDRVEYSWVPNVAPSFQDVSNGGRTRTFPASLRGTTISCQAVFHFGALNVVKRSPGLKLLDPQNMVGGAKADKYLGGDLPNKVSGGAGDDDIDCGNGNDNCRGDSGNDLIRCGPDYGSVQTNDKDLCFGGSGADRLHCGIDSDSCDGGPGNDRVSCGAGNDVCRGGSGNDKVYCGPGRRDIAMGGSGRDALLCRDGRGGSKLNGGPGVDTCVGDRGDTFRSCETIRYK